MLFRKSRARQSIQRLGISKIFFKCSDFGSSVYDITVFLKDELTKIVKVPYDEAFYNWLRSKLKKEPVLDSNKMIECEMQHYYIYLHPSQLYTLHNFAHKPHFIHFSSSISGALNGSFCVIAPTGHLGNTGQ